MKTTIALIFIGLSLATWLGGICKADNDKINKGIDPWGNDDAETME